MVYVSLWLIGGWLWQTFSCSILLKSAFPDASLRLPLGVAIESRTGESSLCNSSSTSTYDQILGLPQHALRGLCLLLWPPSCCSPTKLVHCTRFQRSWVSVVSHCHGTLRLSLLDRSKILRWKQQYSYLGWKIEDVKPCFLLLPKMFSENRFFAICPLTIWDYFGFGFTIFKLTKSALKLQLRLWYTLFSLNFAKNQEPYLASMKFRDFEKKVELECIKFRDIFLFFNM